MHLSSLLRFIWQRVQITSNSKKRMFWCHWQCWSQRGIVYICICFCICTMYIEILIHSSEKTGLRSTVWPRETLQNLLCLCKKKTTVVFSFFISSKFEFYLYECPGLCWHRPGHSLRQNSKLEMKKKNYCNFLFR